jgi:hypothetical protein
MLETMALEMLALGVLQLLFVSTSLLAHANVIICFNVYGLKP